MPKVRVTPLQRSKRIVNDFADLELNGDDVKCKYCNVKISSKKLFSVKQHLETKKHKKNKGEAQGDITDGIEDTSQNSQQNYLTPEIPDNDKLTPSTKKFHEDLCHAMIAADILLNKLSNDTYKSFLKKYTGFEVPNQTTLRKYYVAKLYWSKIKMLQKKAEGQKIWVSIDETTDVEQRFVACFVFGIMGVKEEREKTYLVKVAKLDKVNHSTIAAFFTDSLKLLWPQNTLYKNILLVTTDAASYMCKAMSGLQILFPNMLHVTCLAHGLHRVAETVRSKYPMVDRLVSTVKSIFLKAPKRIQTFKEITGELALPPSPVVTRWGTWLDAVKFYATNLEIFGKAVSELDESESKAISECQGLLNDFQLSVDFHCVSNNFTMISNAIGKLEQRGLALSNALQIVEDVKVNLNALYEKTFVDKFNSVLTKNKGYSSLKIINQLLSDKGNNIEKDEYVKQLSPSNLTAFLYAPVVSCDVESVLGI